MRSPSLTLCSFIFFVVLSDQIFAQEIDSIINIYSDQFQHEKIHIHFDKSVYNKGETVWFKAYLMAGLEASNMSKNLYADWYDAKGKLIAHTLFPVSGSSAKGQFLLPENYTSTSLHVRAYTKWMLNFDSSFLFEKDIIINQPPEKNNSAISPITEVHLFPESGDLLNGVNSKIGFLATNQNGDPVSIRGAIKNSKNEFIDSFFTEHDGMGDFVIDKINADENYFIFWTDEFGKPGYKSLPDIKKSGAVIQARSLNKKVIVGIQRSDIKTEKLSTLYLLAHMNQQVLSKSKINLENRTSALTEINTSNYPTGVLQLTLFNASWQPVAERIVFVNNHQYQFYPTINSVIKGVEKREKNIIEIDVTDSAFANMSLSVTDAGLFQEKNSIVSQFLLSSDIKGKISKPSAYFENDEDSTKEFLDLVMLTHGWRRFKWDAIADAKFPVINYPRDSDYIEIGGTAKGRAFRNVEEKDFVTLILVARDSSRQIIPVPIEQNGNFSKSGFVFFDTINVYYSFKQKNLADRTTIDFRTNLFSTPGLYLKDLNKESLLQFDSAQYVREQFFIEEEKRLEKIRSTTTLKDVTVISRMKPKTKLDIADEKYTSGAFSFESRYRADVINDPVAYSSLDVFTYLQNHGIPGLSITIPQQAASTGGLSGPPSMLPTNQPKSSFYEVKLRGEDPYIYLNESEIDIDAVVHIPMSEVAYIKVFNAPFVAAPGGGFGGAIAVYTKRGDEKKEVFNNVDEKKILTGYTKYQEFYSPNHSDSVKSFLPDTRTTLYWNPYVLTNSKNHKVLLEFYNNDISKKLRVVLEGINADGKLAHIEKIIE